MTAWPEADYLLRSAGYFVPRTLVTGDLLKKGTLGRPVCMGNGPKIGSTELASPLSASLFAATRAEALHSLRHPFVLQLGSGQLPKVSAAPA